MDMFSDVDHAGWDAWVEQHKADGWIRHRGGACPVPDETIVDVTFSDGSGTSGWTASEWMWDDANLVAYRVLALSPECVVGPEWKERALAAEQEREQLKHKISHLKMGFELTKSTDIPIIRRSDGVVIMTVEKFEALTKQAKFEALTKQANLNKPPKPVKYDYRCQIKFGPWDFYPNILKTAPTDPKLGKQSL